GGGVYATGSGSTVTISSGSINDNAASASGGGVYATNSAVVQVIGGRVNANGAPSGGGIYADTGSIVTVTNSAITGNTATTGGGIRVRYSDLSLLNATISSVVSYGLNVGEGVCVLASSHSTVLIVNSTFVNINALQAVHRDIL